MLVGVFLNDADDFLSNTAKYLQCVTGGKSQKTSKLANLSQSLTVLASKTLLRVRPMHGDFFPLAVMELSAYFPPILVKKNLHLKKSIF